MESRTDMGEKNEQGMEAPSKGAIARATGIALAVALLLLFTAVLPAEYGIDPLKTGAALGLTDLAKASETKKADPPAVAAVPTPRRRESSRHKRPSIKWTPKT